MSKSQELLEELKFVDGNARNIMKGDNTLVNQIDTLKGVLQKKRLGTGSNYQSMGDAVDADGKIKPLVGCDDNMNMPKPEKTSAATQFIQKAASEGLDEGKLGEPYKVDAEEYAVAQKHLKKGYKYFVKVPEDDRLIYFRYVQDVGPYMRDNYPNSKMEDSGYIKDMVKE